MASPPVQPDDRSNPLPLAYSLYTDRRPAQRRRLILFWLGITLILGGVGLLHPRIGRPASFANHIALGCIVSGAVLYTLGRRRRKRRIPSFWRLQMLTAMGLVLAGLLSAIHSSRIGLWAELLRWPWRDSIATGLFTAAMGAVWYSLCDLGYRRFAIKPRVPDDLP